MVTVQVFIVFRSIFLMIHKKVGYNSHNGREERPPDRIGGGAGGNGAGTFPEN